MRQHTIRKSVTLDGVGLHSGKPTRVTLSPAPEDTGIVFRVGCDHIAAAPESVVMHGTRATSAASRMR